MDVSLLKKIRENPEEGMQVYKKAWSKKLKWGRRLLGTGLALMFVGLGLEGLNSWRYYPPKFSEPVKRLCELEYKVNNPSVVPLELYSEPDNVIDQNRKIIEEYRLLISDNSLLEERDKTISDYNQRKDKFYREVLSVYGVALGCIGVGWTLGFSSPKTRINIRK